MREGGLEAPVRHPIPWRDEAYTDADALDAELRRVFDICHTCRRCFNLCDSFPRLFDLIDGSETGELDSVASADFKPVVDACTLCDMCFMTKCPYVPPHEFNLDFPHLMLRYRAAERRHRRPGLFARQLTETDRNGRLAVRMAWLVNWMTGRKNVLMRRVMEIVAGVHRRADLPRYRRPTFTTRAARTAATPNRKAPAHGRKAVLYATCFVNYNEPGIGQAARAVLAKNGVACEVVYPRCCAMPQLEEGDLPRVAAHARDVATALGPWIDKGYDVIAPVPSCALMLKFEYPLILPDDPAIRRLAQATFDISEYVVDIAAKEGLAKGLKKIPGGVALHLACHARAQNMGPKAAEMLRLVPGIDLTVIERCSGHGGAWGVRKANFETALKVGKPVARQAAAAGKACVTSECPLAGAHILQGMEAEGAQTPARAPHPIELLARAYGLAE